jgi:thimet oligopeptidase
MTTVRRRASLCALLLFSTTVAAQQPPAGQPPLWSAKPDVAAFEALEDARLATAQRAIDKIVASKRIRTIDNTLTPYDEAIQQLNAAIYFSTLMQQVHPDTAYRDHATAMTTKVSGVATALSLNPRVYRELKRLDVAKADPATQYYVRRQLLEFRLAGVDKDDATRAKLKALQDRLTDAQSNFDRNISDDVQSVEVAGVGELEGLPADYIANHQPGADGKIRLTTQYTDYIPAMRFAASDDLRRRMWQAFTNRAYAKNKAVLRDMMETRYQIATLLGFPSWADYNAADKMVVDGHNIAAFIGEIDAAARPVAEREFTMLLAEKRKTSPGATQIMSYERTRLSELVRRAQFDFDSQSVRPYFPYQRVKAGILDTAAKLFRVEFRQEPGAPAWDPTVETWDVVENGAVVGRFYLDMHPRPGKYSHAQMAPVLDGVRGKQLPEAALVCNFPAPTATDAGLMTYDDVSTFFHEFGHLVHHILGGRQQWAGISGISMEADFAEAPSQMLEEWIRSPQVLASFARHYQSGETIPAELVTRMNRASAFGRAQWVQAQNAYTAISYDVYKDRPQDVDPDATTLRDTRRYTMTVPLDSDGQGFASFGHLAGYSSAYYTYLWDKVIAEDFFQQFNAHDLLAGDAPMRYRRLVLEPGGSMSANDLIKNFLGRAQNTSAFRKWMSEEFAP